MFSQNFYILWGAKPKRSIIEAACLLNGKSNYSELTNNKNTIINDKGKKKKLKDKYGLIL